MLEIRGLSKNYGRLNVLNDANINFEEAGIYAVLGPNGSGKTTLIKSILGMVLPDKGEIIFDGKKINGDCDYRKQISYLPQIARFPDNLTGRELISMVKDLRGQNGNEGFLIEHFGLENQLDKNLKYLSGGTKQKINLVLSLMFDSPVLIFDEPTAGLDPLALIRFKEILISLKEEGKIIILATHIINLVEEIADSIIFLLEGKIYFNGPASELLMSQDTYSFEKAIAQILESNNNNKINNVKNFKI